MLGEEESSRAERGQVPPEMELQDSPLRSAGKLGEPRWEHPEAICPTSQPNESPSREWCESLLPKNSDGAREKHGPALHMLLHTMGKTLDTKPVSILFTDTELCNDFPHGHDRLVLPFVTTSG